MAEEDFIYRISTEQEWEEFQKNGSSFGAEIDKSTCYYHLSKLDQVSVLRFFSERSRLFHLGDEESRLFCSFS